MQHFEPSTKVSLPAYEVTRSTQSVTAANKGLVGNSAMASFSAVDCLRFAHVHTVHHLLVVRDSKPLRSRRARQASPKEVPGTLLKCDRASSSENGVSLLETPIWQVERDDRLT